MSGGSDLLKYVAVRKRLESQWLAIAQSNDRGHFLQNVRTFCAELEREKPNIGRGTFERFKNPTWEYLWAAEYEAEISVISAAMNGDMSVAEKYVDSPSLIRYNGEVKWATYFSGNFLFDLLFTPGAAQERYVKLQADDEAAANGMYDFDDYEDDPQAMLPESAKSNWRSYFKENAKRSNLQYRLLCSLEDHGDWLEFDIIKRDVWPDETSIGDERVKSLVTDTNTTLKRIELKMDVVMKAKRAKLDQFF